MSGANQFYRVAIVATTPENAPQTSRIGKPFQIVIKTMDELNHESLSNLDAIVLPWEAVRIRPTVVRSIRMSVPDIPVLIYGAPADYKQIIALYHSGVNDIIAEDIDDQNLEGSLTYHFENARLKMREQSRETELSREYGSRTRDLAKALNDIQFAYDDTLQSLVLALDSREKATAGHSRRVSAYTLFMSILLGLDENDFESIFRGALLHDIGKIAISDTILLKPGKLTDEEFDIMKAHTTIGREFLGHVAFLKSSISIPLWHHEKVNGFGYPDKLKGDQIPVDARIFALIDVYDALVSERPYKKPFSHEKAISIIKEDTGTHFDEKISEIFCSVPEKVWKELAQISLETKTYPDLLKQCSNVAETWR